MDRDVREHIEAAARGFQEILGLGLTGVYLHGSLAAGAFDRARSDIDLLVVLKSGLSEDERRRLAQLLTSLSGRRPIPEDIEMSVILEDDARDFRHPLPFEFHNSAGEMGAILSGEQTSWAGRTDRDLAAHCTVTRAKGVTLVGKPIREVFGPVPHEDYLDAILHDLDGILESDNILEDPYYSVLNICRVFQVLEEGEGSVPTKLQGAEWARAHLPAQFSPVICLALAWRPHGARDAGEGAAPGPAAWDRGRPGLPGLCPGASASRELRGRPHSQAFLSHPAGRRVGRGPAPAGVRSIRFEGAVANARRSARGRRKLRRRGETRAVGRDGARSKGARPVGLESPPRMAQ